MIKTAVTTFLLSGALLFGRLPGDVFLSVYNRDIMEFRPIKEASQRFVVEAPIYLYVYSTKPFKADHLNVIVASVDEKGAPFSKIETSQTFSIDVHPEDMGAKAKFTTFKSGQLIIRVFSAIDGDKPIAQTQIFVSE